MIIPIIIAVVAIIAVITAAALATSLAASREAADRDFSDRCVDDGTEPCPYAEEEPKLVSVEFLDGENETGGNQWVNLPREEKWLDGTAATNVDRLSQKPRVKVRFNRPGSHAFRVKYLPADDNAAYSGAEKGRNANFKYQEEQKSYSTDGDGTKVIPTDFFVTAAGKDRYRLEAEDDYGNTARSSFIETKRLIYIQEIKMRELTSIATSLATLQGEYGRHAIVLRTLSAAEMDRMANIGSTSDTNTFKTRARAAYTGSGAPDKEPYVIALAYTDHLAVKRASQNLVKANVEVGPGKPATVLPVRGPGLTNPEVKRRFLWRDIVPGEGWFVSARYRPAGGGSDVVIPAARCTPLQASGFPASAADRVRVDVTGLPAGRGTVTVTVNWVDRMRAGISLGGGNAVCVCTRAWWTNKSTASQNEVAIHEIGHQVGMVADGAGNRPDAVATLYDSSKGHVGNHCYHDRPHGQARYDSAADASGSKCVMYGATNGKSQFCENCAPAMRKLDLSGGWSRF